MAIESALTVVLETISKDMGSEDQWYACQVEDKLLHLASFLQHMRKDLRLGGIVGIYLILRGNVVNDEVIRILVDEIFASLSEYET